MVTVGMSKNKGFFTAKGWLLQQQGPEFDGQGNLVLNSTVIVKLNIVLLCSVQYQHSPCPKKIKI